MKKAHILWLLIPIVCGVLFLAIESILALSDEMTPQGSDTLSFFIGLGALLGFPLMVLGFLIAVVASLFQKRLLDAAILFCCAIVTPIVPLLTRYATAPLHKIAETRYIDRFGRDVLRSEAGLLVSAHANSSVGGGYFGTMISATDTPENLRKFSR